MNTYDRAAVGDVLAQEPYREYEVTIRRGNDIEGKNELGVPKTFRTLIAETQLNGARQYACFVIKSSLFRRSRITVARVNEARLAWRESLDVLLDSEN